MKVPSVILALVLLALAQQLARYLRAAGRLPLLDQSKKFLLEELLVLT